MDKRFEVFTWGDHYIWSKQDIKDMIRHWFGSTLSPNTHPCEFIRSMCENKPYSIYKAASFHSRSQGAINSKWHKLTASSCYFIKQWLLDIGLAWSLRIYWACAALQNTNRLTWVASCATWLTLLNKDYQIHARARCSRWAFLSISMCSQIPWRVIPWTIPSTSDTVMMTHKKVACHCNSSQAKRKKGSH